MKRDDDHIDNRNINGGDNNDNNYENQNYICDVDDTNKKYNKMMIGNYSKKIV